jgi:hypothetical protein
MGRYRQIKLIKARCATCEVSLLIKASVKFRPAYQGVLAKAQRGFDRPPHLLPF